MASAGPCPVCIQDLWVPFLLEPQSFTLVGNVPSCQLLRRCDRVRLLRPCCRLRLYHTLVTLIVRQLVRLVFQGGDISRSHIPTVPILPWLPSSIFSVAISNTVG